MGPHSLEKSCRAGRKRCARLRLRICPAISRRRRGARVLHYHRGRATGCERAGNTELLQRGFTARRRAQTAGTRERFRSFADQERAPLPRRMRSTWRRPREPRPSALSRLSPVTIPPAASPRAVHSPANHEPCPPVCPRNCSNAGPMWSRPKIVSPPRFIAFTKRAPPDCRVLRSAASADWERLNSTGVGTLNAFTLEPRRWNHAADFLRW